MADQKITALTAMTSPVTTDIIPIVDDPGGTPATQKITLANMLKVINNLTEDTAPAHTTDFVLTYDTSASAVKKVKPSNLSSVLTTPQINDTSSDHQYVVAVNELAADRTVTLPLLTSNDEFVFKDHAVTQTNKTFTAPVINSATGIGQPRYIIKASDETVNNSSTVQNDNDFVFAIAASEKWMVEIWLAITSVSVNSDFKFDFDTPASCATYYGVSNNVGSLNAWGHQAAAATPTALATAENTEITIGSMNGTYGAYITAFFYNSTNAGNIQFRWAQGTLTAENTVVQDNSVMRYTRLA